MAMLEALVVSCDKMPWLHLIEILYNGMTTEIDNHRLIEVEQIHSPNQSERPTNSEISLLVIHNISLPPGEFGTKCVSELFCNTLDCNAHPYFKDLDGLKVSSHLFINRLGEIVQFVPFDRKAWHAGESEYQGRRNCNEYSIGIELEGTDAEPFTDQQYSSLVTVTRSLIAMYPALTPQRIVGHSDIAPGRKTDPGPCFEWQRYLDSI